LLRVGPCLQSCCLATRWSNLLTIFFHFAWQVYENTECIGLKAKQICIHSEISSQKRDVMEKCVSRYGNSGSGLTENLFFFSVTTVSLFWVAALNPKTSSSWRNCSALQPDCPSFPLCSFTEAKGWLFHKQGRLSLTAHPYSAASSHS
jgi:hypothetical protein